MLRTVADKEVAAFRPLCKRIARRLNGLGGAEFDDLEQEAMIAVWLALRVGVQPSASIVEGRAKNWVNRCRKQGFSE